MIEQFLPVGTTFEANYGCFGHFAFTVLDDGRVRDDEGDEAPMDAIDIVSMRHVELPVVQH